MKPLRIHVAPLFATLALCMPNGALAASPTTNYFWPRPTVGADDNSWGDTINTTTQAIDTQLKAVENIATGVTAATNPSAWQRYSNGSIGTGSGTLSLPLPSTCEAIKILLSNFAPATDGVSLTAQLSNDAVPNWVVSPAYSAAWMYAKTDATTGQSGNSAQPAITISPVNLGNDPGLRQGLEMTILNPNGQILLFRDGLFLDTSGNYVLVKGGGRYASGTSVAYIRFVLGAGNFQSGGSYAVYCNPHL